MTVTKRDGASGLPFLSRKDNRNQIIWIEIIVVIAVVSVLFTVMLPQFMRAQSTQQIASVEKTVGSIADMLATTPGVFAEIDRGYASFPLYNQNGGYALHTISSSVRHLVPMPDGEMRYVGDYLFRQVNIDEFARQYPEVKLPDIDIRVEFSLLLYPEFFAVIGWFGEFSLMDERWDHLMVGPFQFDEDDFVKPDLRLPLYDLSNGLNSNGAIIKTSYDLGWRIKPAGLANPAMREGRAPLEWKDWTKCRDVQSATE
ncbi:MAG: hypothetical protein P9L94_01145 [Candidatus Hinthialibacter antarcticus]|nr:hypothetical protein [Candidatus Hinthialibacter antarcticus]